MINNFKTIVSFQLWYHEPENELIRQDPSILQDELKNGSFKDYLSDLSSYQEELERELSDKDSEDDEGFILAKKRTSKPTSMSKPNPSSALIPHPKSPVNEAPSEPTSDYFKNNPFTTFMDAKETFEEEIEDFKEGKLKEVIESKLIISNIKKDRVWIFVNKLVNII